VCFQAQIRGFGENFRDEKGRDYLTFGKNKLEKVTRWR